MNLEGNPEVRVPVAESLFSEAAATPNELLDWTDAKLMRRPQSLVGASSFPQHEYRAPRDAPQVLADAVSLRADAERVRVQLPRLQVKV